MKNLSSNGVTSRWYYYIFMLIVRRKSTGAIVFLSKYHSRSFYFVHVLSILLPPMVLVEDPTHYDSEENISAYTEQGIFRSTNIASDERAMEYLQ